MSKKNDKDIEYILRQESVASGIINATGAFITFFYFNVIDPAPTTETSIKTLDPVASFIFIGIFITFFGTGISWGNRHKKNFKKWYLLLASGEKSPADVPQKIKRDVLNFPIYTAGIAALMWFGASTIAGYVTWSSRVFIGLMGWGGITAVTLLYFVDDLLWRPIIPVFFPDGNLKEANAFHLPIFWKLLIVFLFIGSVPPTLLVNLTWQRAESLLSTSNPEKALENLSILQGFIFVASVTASVGLSFFITRNITTPLATIRRAMERVQQNDLDVKVIVTTNDELGYLGERFNEMISELRQKELLHNTNILLKEQLAKIESLESVLREQSVRDPLTGLFNRRYMLEILEKELSRSARQKNNVSIVLLDLDDLKKINDEYGHVMGGDQALKAMAKTLQSLCRREDTICRYGGDEFVIILHNTSARYAYERVMEWKDVMSQIKLSVGNKEFGITFSAGIVEYSLQQLKPEELLQYADHALYQAKKAGRNKVMIYSSTE